MNQHSKITVSLALDLDELTILHRVFCSGIVGGDTTVRSRLYDKIVELKRAAMTAKGTVIDGGADGEPRGVQTAVAAKKPRAGTTKDAGIPK